MLGTADTLRRLAVMDQAAKDAEISGFRASIVSKVCAFVGKRSYAGAVRKG
jgi:hypothetical protein